MASTNDARAWWAPACDTEGMTTIAFGNAGAHITVDRLTVDIWRAVEDIFAKYRYTIRPGDTGAYNCRAITGGSGYSLHAYGIAVDVNWSTNPYGPTLRTDMPPGAIREIEALRVDGQQVVRWGGRYSGNKDAMHFEVVIPPSTAIRFVPPKEGLTVSEKSEIIDAINAKHRLRKRAELKILRNQKKILVKLGAEKAMLAEIDRDIAELDADLPEGP